MSKNWKVTHKLVAMVAAMTIGTGASAQEFSGTLSFGAGVLNDGAARYNIRAANFAGTATFGSLSVGTDLTARTLDRTDAVFTFNSNPQLIWANYDLTGGTSVGVYAERFALDSFILGVPPGATLTSVGIAGSTQLSGFEVGAYAGRTTTENPGVAVNNTGNHYGIELGTQLGGTAVAMQAGTSTISQPGFSSTARVLELTGQHSLSSNFLLYGSARTGNMDTPTLVAANRRYNTLAIGLQTDLSGLSGFPMQFDTELSYGTIDLGANVISTNSVRVGITIPFGRAGKASNGTTYTGVIQKPIRDPFTALAQTLN